MYTKKMEISHFFMKFLEKIVYSQKKERFFSLFQQNRVDILLYDKPNYGDENLRDVSIIINIEANSNISSQLSQVNIRISFSSSVSLVYSISLYLGRYKS